MLKPIEEFVLVTRIRETYDFNNQVAHYEQVDHRDVVDNHKLVHYNDWVAHYKQVDHRDLVDQRLWCGQEYRITQT